MLSIITPNLNNAKYLEDNILSVYKLKIPFEHIIVDGGSTDGSIEIISKYPHIKLLHQKEKNGMYGAIDQAIKESQGDFITWVNADDRIIPNGFEKINDFLNKNQTNYDIIYSDGNYFFTDDNHIEFGRGRKFGKFFLRHGFMPAVQPSIFFSKKIYSEVGGFSYDKFKICGDLDLFHRIAKIKKTKFKYLPVLTTIFMKRGNSLGDLNHGLYLKEIKDNKIPKQNLFMRVLYFISKHI